MNRQIIIPVTRPMKRSFGMNLLEIMIVVLVLAIIAAIAFPSFTKTFEKYRLKGAAETVYLELVGLRSLAIKKNATAYLSFDDTDPWCFGVNISAACDCKTSGSCMVDATEKVSTKSEFPDVSLTTNFTDNDVFFSPRNGLPSGAGEITLTNGSGKVIKVLMTGLGNIRMCSNDYKSETVSSCP